MAKQRDVFLAFVLGILGLGILTGAFGDFLGAVGQDGGEDTNGEDVREGTSATFSVAAFDRAADTSTQVAATNYGWKNNSERIYLGSNSGSSSSRSDYTNFVVGDSAEAIAFDSTYDYGTPTSKEVNTEQELANLDVWTGSGTSDLTSAIYSDGSTTTDISTLGANEDFAIDYLQIKNDVSNKVWNPIVVAFKTVSGTNISSIDMPNAEKISVPEHLDSTYDYAFKLNSIEVGGEDVSLPSKEPVVDEWETAKTGKVVFSADSGGTTGETVTISYLDYAPFINTNDEYEYGWEDDTSSPSDVGVGDKTDTLTV